MNKILYVEDDEINALILKKLLSKVYEVKVVENEIDCLAVLQSENFDLILTDINLGQSNEDGILLMKKIKNLPQHKDIKIIAVTAFVLPDEQAYFLEVGFDAYISKPFSESTLKNTIQTTLQGE